MNFISKDVLLIPEGKTKTIPQNKFFRFEIDLLDLVCNNRPGLVTMVDSGLQNHH